MIIRTIVKLNFALRYRPQDPKMNSEPLKFKAGAGQQYTNSEHIFTPSSHPETYLQYDPESEVFPVVIHCVALEGDGKSGLLWLSGS
jgi:hypothetical protein